MTREETIELWRKGKDDWNAWARKWLGIQKKMQDSGKWAAENGVFGSTSGRNAQTDEWLANTTANFANLRFVLCEAGETVDSSKLTPRQLETVRVDGNANAFDGFIFPGPVNFSSSVFIGDALFNRAEFYAQANFCNTFFGANARFSHATFFGPVTFAARSLFCDKAFFTSCRFQSAVDFNRCQFLGNADFGLSTFENTARFDEVEFGYEANFYGIKSTTAFSMRRMSSNQPPDFVEATFHAPPIVDDMEVGCPVSSKLEKDDHRRFRTLRKLADDSGDHLQAMNFFADEQRARRHWVDKPWGYNMARYWMGMAYQGVSGFGRSFMRPLILWGGSTLMFAAIYSMSAGGSLIPSNEASFVSLRHAFIISGLTRTGKLKADLDTLYGEGAECIPDLVGYAMLVQPLVAAIFIFFMLLALRNHFKIGR